MIIEFMIMNEEASWLSAISVLKVDHSKQSFHHSPAHRATVSAFGQRRNIDVKPRRKKTSGKKCKKQSGNLLCTEAYPECMGLHNTVSLVLEIGNSLTASIYFLCFLNAERDTKG